MKSSARRWMVLAVGVGAMGLGFLVLAGVVMLGLSSTGLGPVIQRVVTDVAEGGMLSPQATTAQRRSDPAWKPACEEVGVIHVAKGQTAGVLKNFCLNAAGHLLVCYAPPTATLKDGDGEAAAEGPAIRVYSPAGELLDTWPTEMRPSAICAAKDGTIYVGGEGRVLKLDANGKVLASVASPVANLPVDMGPEMLELLDPNLRSRPEELEKLRANLERRRGDVTGLSVTDQDVFMSVPAPNDFTYQVYRLDRDLKETKQVVEKLRGCCGQMDIQSHDGNLWISHNARHRVECRDREGKQVASFGKSGRVKAKDFGGCCEPKNIRVLPNGDILAAESGPPTCIKRFSAGGEFLGVVAIFKEDEGDCVRVTVEMSADESRYYLLDTAENAIRIFGQRG